MKNNGKKLLAALCAVLAVLLIAFAVMSLTLRRTTVASGKELVESCPRFARPGSEVTVMTAVVTDGEIHVSGAEGSYVRPGVYVFTMPDGNVRLRVTVDVFPDGA